MKVVIDTNCLIASIPTFSKYFWLYEEFKRGSFEWVISNEILTEYNEKVADFYSERTANRVLKILTAAPNIIYTEPSYKWQLIDKDPDDNKFADLALSVNAFCLVSNDKHFNIFKSLPFPRLKVLRLDEFKSVLF